MGCLSHHNEKRIRAPHTAYAQSLVKRRKRMPTDELTGDDGYDDFENGDVEYRRSVMYHPFVLALGAVALFGLGFLSYLFSVDRLEGGNTDGATTVPAAARSQTTAVDTTGPAGSGVGGTSGGDATSTTARAEPEGAYVEASLDLDAGPGPGLFRLVGRVPDTETADALRQAAELSYAPYVESDLEVDESLQPAPWLASGPRVIGLLPSVTDGTIRVIDGRVEVEARSPNREYLALFEGALKAVGGLPVKMVDVEITDLVPPRFEAAVDDGKVQLGGYVPSEAIRQLLEGGAAAAYGPENVASTLTVDAGTYTSFWMYTMPGIFQLFTPFPKFQIRVVEGQASGTLQGGVGFAVDSMEIGPEAAKVLNIGVAIMARDPSIYMTVEGHTDSSGPEDHNMVLSEFRAESVKAYLAAAGIDEARLASSGAGESKPIAPNDTPEGKALNRRVEFLFGPPGSG